MAFDFPSSPTTGQTYSVSGGPTYVYNGTAWVVLTPGNQFNRTVFTATAGQTTFSMNYVVGAVDVFRNGVKMAPADFTATNGTSIVLFNAATVGDTIEVISYPMITYSDAVKRTGDTMTGALAVPSLTVNSVPVLAGPAFRGYGTTSQSVSANTWTKCTYNAETFDTANAYDTGSYKFTAPVSGYYQITAAVSVNAGSSGQLIMCAIYKNGGQHSYSGHDMYTGNYQYAMVSDVLYLANGDYVECYLYVGYACNLINSGTVCYLAGSLVRAA